MERFFAASAGVLLTVILILCLRKQNGEIAALLSLCGCCLVAMVAVGFLSPILTFVRKLQQITTINNEMLQILLKVTGIALTAEIAGTLCSDSGNGALAKTLQMLASAVILYLSLPMMDALLELVERILTTL
ncbi:MAG: hypothetical protein IKY59_05535 [Oscillospiraceae bacterium]|nr:hypothetical protein [Oscillospiraceae bacterium]